MPPFDVRIVTPDDRDAFAAFIDAFEDYRASFGYERDAAVTHRFLGERVRDGETVAAAAFAGDRCTGFALAALRPDILRRTSSWHVHDVFVAANARGAGLGRALMEALLAATRGADGASVTLFARDDNAVALALYDHLGFVRRDGMGMYILGVDHYRLRAPAAPQRTSA
jgi:ribosomal protein S18 acetylase RimI-like enzyme